MDRVNERQKKKSESSGEEILDLVDINIKSTEDTLVEDGKDVTDGKKRKQYQNQPSFYHSKKLIAEGMFDLSLLTANANQLKFILFYNNDARLYYPALVLIILSLILQVAVGILLIFRRRFKSSGQRHRASITNEYLVLLIFLTTLINILVAVFSPVEHSSSSSKLVPP